MQCRDQSRGLIGFSRACWAQPCLYVCEFVRGGGVFVSAHMLEHLL